MAASTQVGGAGALSSGLPFSKHGRGIEPRCAPGHGRPVNFNQWVMGLQELSAVVGVLLGTKHGDRIDSGRPPSGDVRRRECNHDERRSHGTECHRIARLIIAAQLLTDLLNVRHSRSNNTRSPLICSIATITADPSRVHAIP